MNGTLRENSEKNDGDDEIGNIEFIEPSINVYDFQEAITETLTVKYQVLKMNNSALIWIGSNNSPKFSDLSLAMKSPYDTLPLTSKILGHSSDSPSLNLANKLTKKLNKPVYISFNIPCDRILLTDIEKRLLIEIKNNPQVF
ncbi:proteasome assembly chaperone 4 [Lycorma delicatula]|uniref:proteasome assembly chaperone 4 n=1 Tax=Lycorma delicatula TaxID=130591 RepID=UPI003F51AA35